jgi:hypothetical protein
MPALAGDTVTVRDQPQRAGGDGKPWRIGTEVYGDRDILPRDVISRKLIPRLRDERIFFIRHLKPETHPGTMVLCCECPFILARFFPAAALLARRNHERRDCPGNRRHPSRDATRTG